MYERFTDRARKVMLFANYEALRFSHDYVGTEHILLALVKEGAGVAAHALEKCGLDLRKVRLEVEKLVVSGPELVIPRELPQTPRAKKVIEYAIAEARNFGHGHVGTEHLLLGLLRESEGTAAQVLMNLGLRLDTLHQEILTLLANESDGNSESTGVSSPRPALAEVRNPSYPDPDLPEVRYFRSEIDRLNLEKEAAVAEQDFVTAARLRGQADKLQKMKSQFISKWWEKAGPLPNLPGLQEVEAGIELLVREKMAAVSRYDREIDQLKAEKARIVGEWCKQQAAKMDPPHTLGSS